MGNLNKYDIQNGIYSEKELFENFEIIKKTQNGIIAFRSFEDSWGEFVVGLFNSSNVDGTDISYGIFWNGCGTLEPLRELRHSWFGDKDGYVFYLNKNIIFDAIDFLNQYFDME